MIATWAISQNSPKKYCSTRFLLLADFTQCIIEAVLPELMLQAMDD